MSNICRIDQLGMNLLDEITDYLDPVDIVSIFGVNKGLYKLWGSRITRKILKNENFAVDWDLKKL